MTIADSAARKMAARSHSGMATYSAMRRAGTGRRQRIMAV